MSMVPSRDPQIDKIEPQPDEVWLLECKDCGITWTCPAGDDVAFEMNTEALWSHACQ